MLENTRKYAIETALWKAKPADLPAIAPKLAKLANEFAEKLSKYYVFEALSAGSLDACSVVVPAAMERAVLGEYVRQEFDRPDDPLPRRAAGRLQRPQDRQARRPGSDDQPRQDHARVLRRLAGDGAAQGGRASSTARSYCLGVAEDPAHKDKPYYIPPERIEQAKRMIADGRKKGIKFVLPVDSVIQDGSVVDELRPGDQQFDIGPKTSELFEQEVGEFLKLDGAVAFHNGVFGMFEDPRFEEGTRRS